MRRLERYPAGGRGLRKVTRAIPHFRCVLNTEAQGSAHEAETAGKKETETFRQAVWGKRISELGSEVLRTACLFLSAVGPSAGYR